MRAWSTGPRLHHDAVQAVLAARQLGSGQVVNAVAGRTEVGRGIRRAEVRADLSSTAEVDLVRVRHGHHPLSRLTLQTTRQGDGGFCDRPAGQEAVSVPDPARNIDELTSLVSRVVS